MTDGAMRWPRRCGARGSNVSSDAFLVVRGLEWHRWARAGAARLLGLHVYSFNPSGYRPIALENYVAFAPDALTPLGGYPGDEDKARELFAKLDQAKTREDFLAALAFLEERPECSGKVGTEERGGSSTR